MNWFLALDVQILFSYFATIGFALIINTPRRAINLSGWAGMAGWVVYWLLVEAHAGRMLGNLLGALVIGLCGTVFARRKKLPVLIFNIPALVPLVPGATAYQAVRELVLGDLDRAIGLSVRVAIVAGSIAIGFMIAQLISEIFFRKQAPMPKS